ncbi:MAG: FadR family transcriptional regulator [Anaerolineae bacterium]|nr:FadR family transcriptional regulator [Anaerolineae bacterium]
MTKNADGLSSQVAEAMLQRIMSEEFSPGSFLPSERELQEEYQVSRTVIREAIKLLAARGLITTNSRQGTVVNPDLTEPVKKAMRLALYRSNAYIEDVVNTRLLVEPPIAALAAQYATSVQIRQLISLSESFKKIYVDPSSDTYEENRKAWLNNDKQFHKLLAEATQNPILPILVEVVHGLLWHQASIIKHSVSLEHHNIVIYQHEAIANAVASHEPEKASQAMREHIEYGRVYLSGLHQRLIEFDDDI